MQNWLVVGRITIPSYPHSAIQSTVEQPQRCVLDIIGDCNPGGVVVILATAKELQR
jgi:hypothetical protein